MKRVLAGKCNILVGLLLLAGMPALASAQVNCTDGPWVNQCIPGGGPVSRDCLIEWKASSPSKRLRRVPARRVICYEGDPRCDADTDLGNRSCTLPVAACINNSDPRLASCTPSDVASFGVISPVRDATDTANRAALEGRAGPGAGNFGLEIIRDGSTFTPGSANSTPNQCGDPVNIVVPLRPTRNGYATGRRQIRMRTSATDGTRDDDNLIFFCRPSTCGDGVVQHTHETCDDGNRIDGDGCDRGCQSENPNGLTPTPTPSKTPTPTPSSSPTITPTPTFTLEPGAPTFTPVTPSVTPTNTPTITLTFTPTTTPTATPVRVRCTIASGSGVIVPTSFGNASGALTGHQEWLISGPDANGVREIEIPLDGMSFGCGVLNAPIIGPAGVFCVRPDYDNDPGYGYIDCDGGNLTGYNTRFELDHNTNGNASGHPLDPECDDCSTSPDGQESCAKLEDPGSNDPYHAGVCNGPIVASESDPFPANGMVLIQRLIARLRTDVTSCSPNPCPAPDAPFASGDLRVTGKLTTGTSTGVIFNYNNGTGTQTWNVTSTTRTCSQVLASSLTNLQVGLALPFPDLNNLIGDGRIQLRIKCQ